MFSFAPLVSSENDSEPDVQGNLICFKYLFPIHLINKPGELYTIIQQYGPQCSVITKAFEDRNEEFRKQLIDQLEDITLGEYSYMS